MADREQPYDPYIPSGGAQGGAGTQAGGNQRTAALQAVSQTLPASPFQMLLRPPGARRNNTICNIGWSLEQRTLVPQTLQTTVGIWITSIVI